MCFLTVGLLFVFTKNRIRGDLPQSLVGPIRNHRSLMALGRNYITDENYILRKGGTRRDIVAGQFDGHSYEKLLHTPPPLVLKQVCSPVCFQIRPFFSVNARFDRNEQHVSSEMRGPLC